jgi:hypothetical protein
MPDPAIATEIAPGIYEAECSTKHIRYVASVFKRAPGEFPTVWLRCPICDAHRRWGDAYDANEPQYHPYRDGSKIC